MSNAYITTKPDKDTRKIDRTVRLTNATCSVTIEINKKGAFLLLGNPGSKEVIPIGLSIEKLREQLAAYFAEDINVKAEALSVAIIESIGLALPSHRQQELAKLITNFMGADDEQ